MGNQNIADLRLNRVISKAVSGMKPPEKLTVSEWADKYRRLSSESSAEAGVWRTSRTPYLKEIMDCFNDPHVRHIVVVASSQVGKSEAINNMIGYIIDQDPGSILFIQPTVGDAKEYSKLRIAPMIRDTKRLKAKVADPKSRDSANTIFQKSFPGGILTLCGSSEAHSLCSKPIRYIFGDERDRWAETAGDEGDPWKLATTRQLTFYNSKAVEVSTPTIKGSSAIEKSFKTGTMERWKTRCPHCGEFSEIVFQNIRYTKNVVEIEGAKNVQISNIYYICPACGAISKENEIKSQPAKWVPDNPEAYGNGNTRSFWLTSWVSPWTSWKDIIEMHTRAIGNPIDMQVVYNTRFGLLWEYRGDIESEDELLKRREEYKAELPDGVLVLTCGIDTQDDRIEYEVVGHGHFGETWGIKKGIIMGTPDSDEVWQSLDDVLDHVYRFENGLGLKISLSFMDEGGHFTQDVRLRCNERLSKKLFAIKGQSGESIPYTTPPKQRKIVIKGKFIDRCWGYNIGVDAGKKLIMDSLHVQTPGRRYCHFPKRDDYGAAYFNGLLSERYVPQKGHKSKFIWEKIPGHERNEPLDCRNYALAAVKALDPDFDAIDKRLKDKIAEFNKPVSAYAPATSLNTPKNNSKKRRNRSSNEFYDEW